MSDRIFIEDETLRAGFTQIPNAILRHRGISPGAKLTYMVLLSYAWQEGSCFPGQPRMAEDMGVTDRSVRTYLRELEAVGLLITKQRGFGKTNLYFLPRYRPENISDQDRKHTSSHVRQNLPSTNTQTKSSYTKKNKDTQLSDAERDAYYRQLMEDNRDQLAAFFGADNLDFPKN